MLVIYIERWTRKVFRNGQKEEKSEAEKTSQNIVEKYAALQCKYL